VSTNQQFYCGVQCLVIRAGRKRGSNRVLLGRRFRAAGEGQWALPGGHVEWNESPLVTARRELLEETGLVGGTAKLGAAFFTYTTEVPYAHVPIIFDEVQGEPRVISDERFSALSFFRFDDLPRPLFEPSRLALSTLNNGPANAWFGGDTGASFVKIDMASVDSGTNRNRGFTALLLSDKEQTSLIVTWGRREYRGRSVRREVFPTIDQGVRRLEDLIEKRVRHDYYVTGVSGDMAVDRLLSIFPTRGSLQVVSESLIQKLLYDDGFRSIFANNVYPRGYPAEDHSVEQPALFDL
jgi:8-oxo-dGTP diphosphatase